MSEKVVIGLVGEIGAGKGTFYDTLGKIKMGYRDEPNQDLQLSSFMERVSSGPFLIEILKQWCIDPTRGNLQKLATSMDETFGTGTLSNVMKTKITETGALALVFDGVRWLTDVEVIRSFPKNLLVYVTAPAKARFARAKARGEKGESAITWNDFLAADSAETEVGIPAIGERADFKTDNIGTLKDLEREVKRFWNLYLKPMLDG